MGGEVTAAKKMHRSANLSVGGYLVAKPNKEQVSPKPEQAPKAVTQPPARLEQQDGDDMWLVVTGLVGQATFGP